MYCSEDREEFHWFFLRVGKAQRGTLMYTLEAVYDFHDRQERREDGRRFNVQK